jgi:hypothetical protein
MRRTRLLTRSFWCAGLAGLIALQPAAVRTQEGTRYRIEGRSQATGSLHKRFSESQLGLLEKLNRADVEHLGQLREVVLPESWINDELPYSVLPMRYSASERQSTFLVVHLPGQLFGAYEFGSLVRWGPVSSGSRSNPTSSCLLYTI